MDSKIIFIDFEGPSIEEVEKEREDEKEVRVCVLRLGCVSQGQYNSCRTRLFVPVHTLTAHPVRLVFIYISAWMGERMTEGKRVRLRFFIKEVVWQQMPTLFGFVSPEIFGIGANDVNIGGVI